LRSPRAWRERIRDILDAVAAIKAFTQGIAFDAFRYDANTMRAVELDFIIVDYFRMLKSELNGIEYNKSAHRRSLVELTGRTEGSVERKHQNISAVLRELLPN